MIEFSPRKTAMRGEITEMRCVRQLQGYTCIRLYAEVSVILELGNVWVFILLIHRPMSTKNSCTKIQTLPNSRIPATSAQCQSPPPE